MRTRFHRSGVHIKNATKKFQTETLPTDEFGKGFTETNLKYFRQFYITFSAATPSEIRHALRGELRWTHYRGLKDNPHFREQELEQAIIDQLQAFMLELGESFAFVARQQRISTETKDFFIDLVFYNYILKCFVLVDLKTGELTHQDIGQMDMYVRLFEDTVKGEDDNPTVGLILCTEKDHTAVKYSVLNENRQLFASKYRLYLPTEEELRAEIEREREVVVREQRGRYGETVVQ